MGRPKGALNKSTKRIKELCQEHTDAIIRRLVNIAVNSPNEANAVAASRELLDRGYGKARQEVEHSTDGEAKLVQIYLPSNGRDEPTASTGSTGELPN